MKKTIITLLALVAVVLTAMAQERPIRWRLAVSRVAPDSAVVTVRAIVAPGWHLYGTEMPADGPRPTTFDFSGSDGVEPAGEMKPDRAPVEGTDEMFGAPLSWWDAPVAFAMPVRITAPEAFTVKVTVGFMGCNDVTCLPPSTQTLTYRPATD